MNLFETLATIGVSTTALVGIAAFFGQQYILSRFNKTIETHKQELENRFKTLQHEHAVRFSRMHDERTEVIKKLYHLLVEQHQLLLHLLPLTNSERYNELAQMSVLRELTRHFLSNRIFLSRPLCEIIGIIIQRLGALSHDISIIRVHLSDTSTTSIGIANRSAIYQSLANEVDGAIMKVEHEFRRIMGADK